MSWITADSIRSKILTPQVLERRGFGEDGTPLAGNDKTFGNRISSLAKQNTAAAERQASEDTKNVRREAIKIRESSTNKGANWIKMAPNDPRRTTFNTGTDITDTISSTYSEIYDFLTTDISTGLQTNYNIIIGNDSYPSGLQWINSNAKEKEGTSFDTVIVNTALSAAIKAKRDAIIGYNSDADLSTHEFDFTAEEWAVFQISVGDNAGDLTYNHFITVDGDNYQPLQPRATKNHTINRYHIVDADVDENYLETGTGTEYVLVGTQEAPNADITGIIGESDIKYGDYIAANTSNYVWVLSRSTEDEREYQRTNERDVKELRRRCIRIREKKTDGSKIGQIWIKMKENDPRRTETVNIGTELTPDAATIQVLTNNASAFDASHTYYGKYFVVDSKIDSEHNYIVRNSPTGFEYVFDNGNIPTITDVSIAYGDFYKSGNDVWVVSRSTEDEREYQRTIEKNVKELRRRCIRIREKKADSTKIGQIWIKMKENDPRRTDTVNIGTPIDPHTSIKEVLTNNASAFDASHTYYGKYFVVDSKIDSEHNYIVRNSPTGFEYVFDNNFNLLEIDNITVSNNGTGYGSNQVVGLVITGSDGINPIISAVATVTANDVGEITSSSTVNITKNGLGYYGDITVTSSQNAEFLVILGEGGIITGIDVTRQGVGYAPGELSLTFGGTGAGAAATLDVPDSGIIDIGSNITITSEGANYVEGQTTATLGVNPGTAATFDVSLNNIYEYGDYYYPNTNNSEGFVWVVSRSTEDEREYQRTIERDVKELRRRCIRIRENSTTIGQIWIKMKENDPRRTETVNIGTERTPDAATIQVLTNNALAFDTSHTYYGKYFVVDSKIDSEHNYVVRNSPTGFEYVFDNENGPTITGVSIAYGDFYKSGNDVWVVSRSTESEREYQRIIEKEVKELRRSCIRQRENSTTIGQIWIKEPANAVKIQGYKYNEISIDNKLKEVFANKLSVFALGHDYYRQFFVVDSHIDSEHDYVVRNSPSGITYVFNNMTMTELNSFNTTLDYGNYVKLGDSISEITVIDTALDYKEGQIISLVINPPDGITPIIAASATITVPVGGINNTTPVTITEKGLGYDSNTLATIISSQVAEFLVTIADGGKIDSIDVIRQGVGYADGELNLTITDNAGTATEAATAKVNVPSTGIIDIGSSNDIGSSIEITAEGAGYTTENVTATLDTPPGTPLVFTVTQSSSTDRFVVSRSTEVMREYMKSIEVSREAAREMYRLQEGISLLNNLEAWDPENRIGRIWIYVSDTEPSTGTEITDSIYPGFPNSLMYGVPSGYSWYKYGSVAPNNVSVIFNDASVGATGTTDEGKITEITISGAGSGYTPGEIIDLTITDQKTPTTLATATVAVDSSGDIALGSNINVTNVGAGYSGNVSVTLPLPDSSVGTEAKFNATVTNGSIAIEISQAGSGYNADTNATLIITDNGGNGASARVTVNFDGTIKTTDVVQITNSGSGYSPKVSVSCDIAPNTQVPLDNSELATALALRQDFTPSEWNSFGITDLTNDHYILVDSDYYKPVPGKLIYTSEELDQYGLNTIDSTYWVRNTGTTAPRNSGYYIPSYHINQNYKNLQYPSNVLNNLLGRVWLNVDKQPTGGTAYTSALLKTELDAGTLSFTLDRLDELDIVSAYSSGLNWQRVDTLPSSGIVFIDSGLTALLDGSEAAGAVKTITKIEWDNLSIDIALTENHYIIGSSSASDKYYKPVNKNTLTSTSYITSGNSGYYVPGYWVNSTFKDAYYPLVDPTPAPAIV